MCFEKNGTAVINPGKGWILYGLPENQDAKTLALSMTGYLRWDWSVINPAEGEYNWQPIDDAMESWRCYGKQFAFGIMSVNVHGHVYATPEWIFEKGAAYTLGNGLESADKRFVIPVWDDPVYAAECKTFAAALAARYDGNPNLAFIDIRNYGNWGEMHMFPFNRCTRDLTDEQVQTLLVQPYLDYFKETDLVLSWSEAPLGSINQWAVDNGLGLRRDGIMGRKDWTDGPQGEGIRHAAGITPVVWEFFGTYKSLETQSPDPWDDTRFINAVIENKPDYIGMGQWEDDARYMLKQKPELIYQTNNKMGFHFTITNAEFTTVKNINEPITVLVAVENSGVNRMLRNCVIKLVLLNADGEASAVCNPGWNANTIAPGETKTFSAEVCFPEAEKGHYIIAAGFYRQTEDAEPTYRVDNQNKTSKGFYPLGALEIK